MKYRLSDIHHFLETQGCPTITQAAQKLEISQPALSESLKRLESDLGATLFYRSRTGIQLTSSGRKFLKRAKKLMEAYSHLSIKEDIENSFADQTISIGCHPSVAQYSLPKALSALKKRAPDYRIELRHGLSRNIQSEIQRGNIDIGIVINPVKVPDIIISKLAKDNVCVWSKGKTEDCDTVICNLELFQTRSILKKWKNRPSKVILTESLELICQLVEERIGVGIIPERVVQNSAFSLQQLEGLPKYQDEICLVYRPEFGKATAEKLLIEALKSVF